MRILIVEDERKLANTLKCGLKKSGYAIDCIVDGDVAKKHILFNNQRYDLIILDWILPTRDGLQICKDVRNAKIQTPILMLTAHFEMKDKVLALNSGVDDYIVKPFSFEELEARIRALLRRPVETTLDVLETKKLKIDFLRHRVLLNDKNIRLTVKEFSLLEYLLRNANKVVTRSEILDHLWDINFDSFSNVVDSHMKNLKKKIQNKKYPLIETVRGIGYKIKNIQFIDSFK